MNTEPDEEETERGKLLARVFHEIRNDVYVEDFTAIAELLRNVSDDDLLNYLPEE